MTTPFPPPGFVKTTSAVEGIEVYMPAPPDPAAEEQRPVVAFDCPQCGGQRAYSAADGGLICTACGYQEVLQKEIVGKGAQEFEFKVETLAQIAHGWGIARSEMQCQNCGAVTVVPPEMLTTTCSFCHSSRIIQRKAAQDMLRPRFLIPFEVDRRDCQPVTKKWLGSNWMTPGTLNKLAALNDFTPIYIPFWTFDSTTVANWQAEVGHTVTTGSGKNRRTTTVWRWESGRVTLNHDDVLISGTTHVSNLLLRRIRKFRLDKLVPYSPEYLAGSQAQAYDIPLEPAWELARTEMREKTKDACYRDASSGKVRNFSMTLDFNNESWRYILVPIYLTSYRFQDKVFQVMINGQTREVCGQRPVSWIRVGLMIALFFLPGLLLGLFTLLDPQQIPFLLPLLLLGTALFMTFFLVKIANELDDV